MNNTVNTEVQKYADLAFSTSRQKIDDQYRDDLADAVSKLAAHGMSHSSGREAAERRLKTEKLAKLILAKTEVLLEAYESHGVTIDEADVLQQINSLSVQSSAAMVSTYKAEATRRGVGTGRPDPALPAKAQSFDREMRRKSQAALTEAKLLIKKKKLAQTQAPAAPTHIHHEYHLHGPNSRVNVQSNDQSTNTVYVQPDEVFVKIREQLTAAISDITEQAEILQRLSALEEAQGTPAFTERLGTFLAFGANWITVITPFLPALAEIARNVLPG